MTYMKHLSPSVATKDTKNSRSDNSGIATVDLNAIIIVKQ